MSDLAKVMLKQGANFAVDYVKSAPALIGFGVTLKVLAKHSKNLKQDVNDYKTEAISFKNNLKFNRNTILINPNSGDCNPKNRIDQRTFNPN